MTFTTDGLLNFWNFSILNCKMQKLTIDNNEDGFFLHQSGINSFDVKFVNDNEYLLATGGDDNLLSLILFKINRKTDASFIQIVSSWNSSLVHYAQISGEKKKKKKIL